MADEGQSETLRAGDGRGAGERPLVSIGLPVYNGIRFLERALLSLRAQTYPAFELIISDNASTDGTYELCQRHAAEDPRIRLIRQPENRGAHFNFRAVTHEASGVYFMFAADDDVWLPDFVSRLVADLEAHPEAGASMCAIERVLEDDTPLDHIRFVGRNDLATKSALGRGFAVLTPKKYNIFIYALFRADLIKRCIDLFPESLGGDRMLICQLALAAPLRFVDEVLYVRTHRPSHEASYLRQSKSPRVRLHQLISFCRMLVTSPVIPGTTKLATPLLAAGYAGFLMRKEAYDVKVRVKRLARKAKVLAVVLAHMSKRFVTNEKVCLTGESHAMLSRIDGLLNRALRGRGERAAVALASVVALLGFVTSLIEGRSAGSLSGLAAQVLLWASIALAGSAIGVALIKLMHYRRLWLQDRALVSGTNDRVERVNERVERMNQRLEELAAGQRGFDKALKYSTDLLLSPDEVDQRSADENWPYGLNKKNTVQKQVYFARSLEESRIRELYLHEIFPGIDATSLPIGAINELSGHPNKVDMLYVCAIAKFKNAKNIFEFGTYQGRTTYHFALTSDDTRVTTLDLPPNPDWAYSKYNGIYFREKPAAERITQIYHDSRTLDTGPIAKQFDFVFVDADHSYDAVKNDTEKAFELLKPGGVVMWHDYAPKSAGLVQFIKEFTNDRVPLFRIKRTCLLLYIDGVDPLTFEAAAMLPSLELAHQATDPFQVEQIYHH